MQVLEVTPLLKLTLLPAGYPKRNAIYNCAFCGKEQALNPRKCGTYGCDACKAGLMHMENRCDGCEQRTLLETYASAEARWAAERAAPAPVTRQGSWLTVIACGVTMMGQSYHVLQHPTDLYSGLSALGVVLLLGSFLRRAWPRKVVAAPQTF